MSLLGLERRDPFLLEILENREPDARVLESRLPFPTVPGSK